MDALLELILTLIFEPVLTLLFQTPIEMIDESSQKKRLPKWVGIILLLLFILLIFALFAAIIVGAVLTAQAETETEKIWGIVLLTVGITLFVGYFAFTIVRYINKETKLQQPVSSFPSKTSPVSGKAKEVGQKVHILVDKPIGSAHPIYDDAVYEVNYGFAPDYETGDGEYQNAYILGVDEPVAEFDGVITAIIHHYNNNEDVWIVVPEGYEATNEEIKEKTDFQEKHFICALIRR